MPDVVTSEDYQYGIKTTKGIQWFDGSQHTVKETLVDVSLLGVAYIHACSKLGYGAQCVKEYAKYRRLELPKIECGNVNEFWPAPHEIEDTKDARSAETFTKRIFSTPRIPGLRASAMVKNGHIMTTRENLENAKLCASMNPMPIEFIGESVVIHFDRDKGEEYIDKTVLKMLNNDRMMWKEVHHPNYADGVIKGLVIYNSTGTTTGKPTQHKVGDWVYYTWHSNSRYQAVMYSV